MKYEDIPEQNSLDSMEGILPINDIEDKETKNQELFNKLKDRAELLVKNGKILSSGDIEWAVNDTIEFLNGIEKTAYRKKPIGEWTDEDKIIFMKWCFDLNNFNTNIRVEFYRRNKEKKEISTKKAGDPEFKSGESEFVELLIERGMDLDNIQKSLEEIREDFEILSDLGNSRKFSKDESVKQSLTDEITKKGKEVEEKNIILLTSLTPSILDFLSRGYLLTEIAQ